MTATKLANLNDLFNAMTVGFDDIFNNTNLRTSSYPPHNVIKTADNNYVLEFALAGFSKDNIEVTVTDGVLTIKGEAVAETEKSGTFLHKGISSRSFVKSFKLDSDIKVRDGEMNNGILRIELEKIIPEEKKPFRITLR